MSTPATGTPTTGTPARDMAATDSGPPRALKQTPPQEVWVTGIGAVSAFGWSAAALWGGLLPSSSPGGIRRPKRLDVEGHRTELAAEVPDPQETGPEAAELPPVAGHQRRTRADRFAVSAAAEALQQAAVPFGADAPALGPRAGVFFGTSTAGMPEGEDVFYALLDTPAAPPRLRSVVSHQMNGPGDEVARTFGVGGPVESLSSACAAAGLAFGAALDALRHGEVDLALAGGADALCQLTYAGFNALRAVDEAPCRPFRAHRAGLSLGEGAGVLVLETATAARRRGARPLARLLGAGASCDAHHMTAPHPEGEGATRALRAALADAGLAPEAIDFVNAHGTGTPHNDGAEANALRTVFGERSSRLPLTSTKGATGHLLGASGGLEAVATVLCLRHGVVHPTPDGSPTPATADPEFGVDLVVGAPRPLPTALTTGLRALSSSFAFGGANAALVFDTPGAVAEQAAAATARDTEG